MTVQWLVVEKYKWLLFLHSLVCGIHGQDVKAQSGGGRAECYNQMHVWFQ